jgi:opacity protein-like surface antigen
MRRDKTRRGFLPISILALLACLWSTHGLAQVVPSASRGSDTLWVGAEYSNFNASFPYQSGQRLQGVGAFVDFNFDAHLGVEANARFLPFRGHQGETESSYLIGPRYRFRYLGRFQPHAQGLIGAGNIHYPFNIGNANYFDIAPGGGVNYRLSGHWLLRAEYEYQFWLNSPGYSNQPDHQLRPNGINAGVAYRLSR